MPPRSGVMARPGLLLAVVVGLVASATLLVAPASATPDVVATAHQSGRTAGTARAVHVLDRHRQGRVITLRVRTPSLARPVDVDLLLPRGYGAHPHRRYPTLYLLHGTSGRAADWVTAGDVTRTTRRLPWIVVMPDGGYDGNGGGWYTDWVDQHTALGRADWETFHVRELLPWVDRHFRTRADRHDRAIAGLSQGGFGSMSYAARHPRLFGAAASFSGAPDIARNPAARAVGALVVGGILSGLDGVSPYAAFGDPIADAANWRAHNPASLVGRLRHTRLDLWTGTGVPGPHDQLGPATVGGVPIEVIVSQSTRYFEQAADAAHVRYHDHSYLAGTHTWPYWAQDLRDYLPLLRAWHARG